MIDKTEVLKVRKYRVGYEVRTERVTMGKDTVVMRSAYNPAGHYIGDSRLAHRLVKVRGIAPELAHRKNQVCSIGFCKKNRKWYGWSHRAIFGFGVGSKVKKGDCAASSLPIGFLATNLRDAKRIAIAFADSVA